MTDKVLEKTKETDSHTRFFDATLKLMPQLRPFIGLFVGMNDTIKELAEEHCVDAELLTDWAIEQIPLRITIENPDEENEGEE